MRALVLSATKDPRPGYELTDWERATGKVVSGCQVWRFPQLAVSEIADPGPGRGQVLINVKAVGVCGSDVHFYETDAEGYILYPGLTRFPAILGHEFAGQVVALGEGVSDLQVGDMVTAEEMIWCGECDPCRSGFVNQCQRLEEIGFTIDGAFAEYIAIGAKYCWKIDALAERCGSEARAYEAGALVEPTSVAYNGIFVRAGGFRPGAYVSIFGTGPIGLASIALCRAAGAAQIMAFETSSQRRELAREFGVDDIYDPTAVSPAEVIMELTRGAGADLAVEAAGAPGKTVPEMERSMAINGRIVQIGRAAQRVPIYLENFQVRHAQFFGAQGHSGNSTFGNVIRMMAAGSIDMTRAVTARHALDQVVDAIRQSGSRNEGKIMVTP